MIQIKINKIKRIKCNKKIKAFSLLITFECFLFCFVFVVISHVCNTCTVKQVGVHWAECVYFTTCWSQTSVREREREREWEWERERERERERESERVRERDTDSDSSQLYITHRTHAQCLQCCTHRHFSCIVEFETHMNNSYAWN